MRLKLSVFFEVNFQDKTQEESNSAATNFLETRYQSGVFYTEGKNCELMSDFCDWTSPQSQPSHLANQPIIQFANYPISQLSNYPFNQLTNYTINQLASYTINQLANYTINQLSKYTICRLSNYPISRLANQPIKSSLDTSTIFQGPILY